MINDPLAVRVYPGSSSIISVLYLLDRIGPCHAQFQRTEKTERRILLPASVMARSVRNMGKQCIC